MSGVMRLFGIIGLVLILALIVYEVYSVASLGEIDLIFTKIRLNDIDVGQPFTNILGSSSGQIAESDIQRYFEDKGFEFWSADTFGPNYIVEINTDFISDDLLAVSLEDASYLGHYLKGKTPSMDTVQLDVYLTGYPIYRISGPVDSLASAYENGSEAFLDDISIEDIRTLDFKIQSDLWVFDYLTEVESIDESSAVISITPYQEDVADMSNDLVAMAFMVLQQAPFLDSISFEVQYGIESWVVTLQADDILAYMNGEISFEDLMNNSGTSSL